MIHVFDVDGTLIASNQAKGRAFHLTARTWGAEVADAALAYHQQAGSVSREDRWRHIFAEIIGITPSPEEFRSTVETCTRWVEILCADALPIPGAREFVATCEERMVVSGIAQAELGEVLERHGYGQTFSGVFGGCKGQLLKGLVERNVIALPAVYYGDTRDDWLSATAAGLDFVLVTHDTEWAWEAEYDGPQIADFTARQAA